MVKKYSLINNLTGWLVFAVSAIVYLLTIEPTVSLWDCGEFIATANKLEVGHPPGAPMFLMIARFFAIFAGDNVELVAKMVNIMSALASAFTILFLFWTITRLAKKVYNNSELTLSATIGIIGSGVVGALAYTFSDTFWFSAVEGEVYALSSFFTAVVFWVILKWEDSAFESGSDKWLVVIAYIMGLSIGVHLLNLLAIPAIVFVYYFKKFPVTRKGILISVGISIISIAFVMWGMIQGSIKVASKLELFFVNTIGMPYNSGLIIYLILLSGTILLSLYSTSKQKGSLLNTIAITSAAMLAGIPFMGGGFLAFVLIVGIAAGVYLLSTKYSYVLNTVVLIMTVIVIGYSSYAMIVIRSYANPPMDENNPENVFTLLSYLNREQYGDRPLMFGPYYNAPVAYEGGRPVVKEEKSTYIQKDGKYEEVALSTDYEYDKRFTTFFPRMYSTQESHIKEYQEWAKIQGKPIRIEEDGEPKVVKCPTFGENIRFFVSYQLNHMYWRYFMWNFSGRQNDEQSHGGIIDGNWITGIDFVDSMFLGNQEKITDQAKNHPARNAYFMLPFIFGLIGFIFQLKRNPHDFITVLLLFFFTGIAIVVYLNQTPIQPRERDYAYAGSFYAYTIWIGLAVMAFYKGVFEKLTKTAIAPVLAILLVGVAPYLMAKDNWDDHDRSGRYTARDYAANYLETCAPNALIFTAGDNDTFPLWYAQEVEGIRTDVRVVCLPLLSTDWYAEQMTRKTYFSDPLPLTMTKDKFVQGTRDYVPVFEQDQFKGKFLPLKKVMDFVLNDSKEAKVKMTQGMDMNYLPAKNFTLPIDKKQVIDQNILSTKDASSIVDTIKFSIKGRYVLKNELVILDILDDMDWSRPIYFTSINTKETLGLDNYMRFDGFAYKFVPAQSYLLSNTMEYFNDRIRKSDDSNQKEKQDLLQINQIMRNSGKFSTVYQSFPEFSKLVNDLLGENFASYIPMIIKRSENGVKMDTELTYNNVMNKYKWGRMNEDDVYIDHFNVRTMRVIGIRGMFADLANALTDEGKLDSAVAVLDRCMELMPKNKVPYEVGVLQIAEAYYNAQKFDKANAIMKDYALDCFDQIEYFSSLTGKFRGLVKNEEQRTQYIVSAIIERAKQFNQKQLADELESLWQTYMSLEQGMNNDKILNQMETPK